MNRLRRRFPPGLLLVTVLVLVAAVWLLVLERGGEQEVDPDTGAPLLPFPATAITRLVVTQPAGEVRLEATARGWELSGLAVDLVDPTLVAHLLQSLRGEFTGTVLPGTQDRSARNRYGIEPDARLRVRVVGTDSRTIALAIGAGNPVNGRYYAAGAGRSGVFTVSPELVERLAGLPNSIRLRRLLPPFEQAAVETVAIGRPGRVSPDLFVRADDGHWWLRQPTDGRRRLGTIAREYDTYYGDRRRELSGQSWWLASDRALTHLVYLLDETGVREFRPGPAIPESLQAAGLAPPTVTVRLVLGGGGQDLRMACGAAFGQGRMAASRQDLPNVLLVTDESREELLAPLSRFLETGALPFTLAVADSFQLRRNDVPPLFAHRTGENWRARLPERSAEQADRIKDEDLLGDLVVYLDRLSCLEVLPPRPGEIPLAPGYRIEMSVWLREVDGVSRTELVFGYLRDSNDVAVYFPDGGKWLRVPNFILSTLRTMFFALAGY